MQQTALAASRRVPCGVELFGLRFGASLSSLVRHPTAPAWTVASHCEPSPRAARREMSGEAAMSEVHCIGRHMPTYLARPLANSHGYYRGAAQQQHKSNSCPIQWPGEHAHGCEAISNSRRDFTARTCPERRTCCVLCRQTQSHCSMALVCDTNINRQRCCQPGLRT